jgi:hypothetical protein
MDRIYLAQDRDGWRAQCGNEPSGAIKCGKFLDWLRSGLRLKEGSDAWRLAALLEPQSMSVPFIPLSSYHHTLNTLRTGSFKLFKRPFPGFLTILTL